MYRLSCPQYIKEKLVWPPQRRDKCSAVQGDLGPSLQLKDSDLLGSSVGVGYSVTLSGSVFYFCKFPSVSIETPKDPDAGKD